MRATPFGLSDNGYVGDFESRRNRFYSVRSAPTDSADLPRRVASGPVLRAPPPFEKLQNRIRTAGIAPKGFPVGRAKSAGAPRSARATASPRPSKSGGTASVPPAALRMAFLWAAPSRLAPRAARATASRR